LSSVDECEHEFSHDIGVRDALSAAYSHIYGCLGYSMTDIVTTVDDFSLYNPNPTYFLTIGQLDDSWRAAVTTLPTGTFVLAIDGSPSLDWSKVSSSVLTELLTLNVAPPSLFVENYFKEWGEITRLTASPELGDDPDFATLPSVSLADLLLIPEEAIIADTTLVIFGPGAALFPHDVLWYVDLPKRYCEAALVSGRARNLGQPNDQGTGSAKRQLFIDWPILDHHRDAIARGVNRWIDLSSEDRPISLDGSTFLSTLSSLATQPFRARPTFNTAPWGGHWGQDSLGHELSAENTAVGFQLLAPESGVSITDDTNTIEVPLSLLVSLHPEDVLGTEVTPIFGESFPVRFNYLDTVRGDHLSVHCHPQASYMRQKFGWPYTQHESYYVIEGGERGHIFLGLRGDANVEEFAAAARAADDEGVAFDVEKFIQFFPSTRGQLFMIPAGTPHGSSKGNVVLEVSATPYLYSLRFYDWLRRDARGDQRPVHVDHAFQNLDVLRVGDAVRHDLIQTPEAVRDGEEVLGALPECFFEVRRLSIAPESVLSDHTAGRFHVLNVVDGQGVVVTTEAGHVHVLHRGETLLVPAACGHYDLRCVGDVAARVVKALVA
jgi:mannose-6-phosphate isomerase class I